MCMAIIEELQTPRLLRIRINVHVDLLIIFKQSARKKSNVAGKKSRAVSKKLTLVDH